MKNITAIFLTSATLIACSNMPDRRDHHVEWRSDLKREGKIVELDFDRRNTHLTQEHKAAIQDQLSTFDQLDNIYVRVFADSTELTPLTSLQQARLKKVKTYMARKGIKGKHIKFYHWKESRFGQLKENTIVITFDKNQVAPSKCPNWNSKINDHEAPEGTPDFGCANAYNHAVLVADKGDLIEGKKLRDRDSSMKLNAVKDYQKDKTKELKTVKSATTASGSSN